MNIGEYGLRIFIVAAQTFPMGFELKTFSDDIDPVVFDRVRPVKYEHLIDGSLFFYNTSFALNLNISVISGSTDDQNLKMILQNKMSPSLVSSLFSDLTGIEDTMVMVVNYATNGSLILSDGNLIAGNIADTVLSSGRRKSNSYQFVFNNVTNLQGIQTDVMSLVTNIGGLL